MRCLVDNDIHFIEHFCVDFALREQQEQATAAVEHGQRHIGTG